MVNTKSQAWWWDFFMFLLRILKIPIRWLVGTHEIERILGRPYREGMVSELEAYIYRSKQLASVSRMLKSPNFVVMLVVNEIIRTKKLRPTNDQNNSNNDNNNNDSSDNLIFNYVNNNLQRCLSAIKFYNEIKRDMNDSIIPFDIKNEVHKKLLKKLWYLMKPLDCYQSLSNPTQQIDFEIPTTVNVTTTQDTNNGNKNGDRDSGSSDSDIDNNNNNNNIWYCGENHIAWELLGFQSEKPETDFRGMGIFALKQMIWFAKYHNKNSTNILKYCQQNGQLKVFSYAITGIALTNDCVKLFNNDKCKKFIYDKYYDATKMGNNNSNNTNSERDENKEYRINGVNELYGKCFMEFHKLWMNANPINIMEYANVHSKFLQMIHHKLEMGTFETQTAQNI